MIDRYLEEMGLTMLCLLPVWALLRWAWLHRKGYSTRGRREVLMAAFVLFLVALAQQTILPQIQISLSGIRIEPWDINGCNYIPLYTISRFLRYGSPGQIAVNLIGNVIVFVPLGLLPPLLWRRWRGVVPGIGFGMLCSIVIEIIQPLVGRSRDIDDVILNTLGCALGYILGRLLLRGGFMND